jgi:hypothetical protein
MYIEAHANIDNKISSDKYGELFELTSKEGLNITDPKLCVIGEAYNFNPPNAIDRCSECTNLSYEALEFDAGFMDKFTKHWNEQHVKN